MVGRPPKNGQDRSSYFKDKPPDRYKPPTVIRPPRFTHRDENDNRAGGSKIPTIVKKRDQNAARVSSLDPKLLKAFSQTPIEDESIRKRIRSPTSQSMLQDPSAKKVNTNTSINETEDLHDEKQGSTLLSDEEAKDMWDHSADGESLQVNEVEQSRVQRGQDHVEGPTKTHLMDQNSVNAGIKASDQEKN